MVRDALHDDVEDPSFVGFVAARSSSLQRSAWLLTGDQHMAEDLLQASLAAVWPRWSQVVRHGGDAEAYVRKVLYTTYVSWWRRRSWHEKPTAEVMERRSGVDVAAQVANRTALTAALAVLPPRQRAAVVLRYYDDLTINQAAEVLGISAGSVTTHVARALTALRESGLLEGMEDAHHG